MTEILKMTNLKIEGFSDEQWMPIVKGVDVSLNKGEVLGLIGESGAGKSCRMPCPRWWRNSACDSVLYFFSSPR